MSDLDQRWLTLTQAAQVTGRSAITIRRWTTHGRLRYVDLDGTRYVKEHEALLLERDTRHAARRGRPGARPRKDLRSGD